MATPVEGFFSGKNIFLTGGTGFLGIALIEKILRAFPDVSKNIYPFLDYITQIVFHQLRWETCTC